MEHPEHPHHRADEIFNESQVAQMFGFKTRRELLRMAALVRVGDNNVPRADLMIDGECYWYGASLFTEPEENIIRFPVDPNVALFNRALDEEGFGEPDESPEWEQPDAEWTRPGEKFLPRFLTGLITIAGCYFILRAFL